MPIHAVSGGCSAGLTEMRVGVYVCVCACVCVCVCVYDVL